MVYSCLQRKANPELQNLLQEWSVSKQLTEAVLLLTELHGSAEVLDEARAAYKSVDTGIVDCINELQQIAEMTTSHVTSASLLFDLADLKGYKYHNAMMFTAYIHGQGQGIAFGGRYDGIGKEFGRSRPATGFSADVKLLYDLVVRPNRKRTAIYAPDSTAPGLIQVVSELRDKGERVIFELPGQSGDARQLHCDRELYLDKSQWKVRNI